MNEPHRHPMSGLDGMWREIYERRIADLEARLATERQAAASIAAICLNAGCRGEDGSTVSAVRQLAGCCEEMQRMIQERSKQ